MVPETARDSALALASPRLAEGLNYMNARARLRGVPLPLAVHQPDLILRLRIARFRQRTEQPDRGHIVAAVIGHHAVFPWACLSAGGAHEQRSRDHANQRDATAFLPVRRMPRPGNWGWTPP